MNSTLMEKMIEGVTMSHHGKLISLFHLYTCALAKVLGGATISSL